MTMPKEWIDKVKTRKRQKKLEADFQSVGWLVTRRRSRRDFYSPSYGAGRDGNDDATVLA
jgi:hypothetical protein